MFGRKHLVSPPHVESNCPGARAGREPSAARAKGWHRPHPVGILSGGEGQTCNEVGANMLIKVPSPRRQRPALTVSPAWNTLLRSKGSAPTC